MAAGDEDSINQMSKPVKSAYPGIYRKLQDFVVAQGLPTSLTSVRKAHPQYPPEIVAKILRSMASRGYISRDGRGYYLGPQSRDAGSRFSIVHLMEAWPASGKPPEDDARARMVFRGVLRE